ncbi:GNAT family N-acetyltransferase [Actinomadura sp. NEAU-AAG7]|uniref:GNAT family N-acetyltransferase n=1 Tax=Actinomadura sp. NEAU-AAG7 TaxID=2839640 RepID=UPI002032C677|nr:GNAT family N-acetyltransferase [Actinomadura sp. NEAU-AAG7]
MPVSVHVEVRAAAWDDPAAEALRRSMDAEMRDRYEDRLEEIEALVAEPEWRSALVVEPHEAVHVAVAYASGEPVGHAALRRLDGGDLELKRMYVASAARGTGVSTALLAAVEDAARALGASRLVLQTGDRQPDAVRLYEREGYTRVPVFPPYERLHFSICMAKVL